MRAETFQITLTNDPLAGVDRSGRDVADVRAETSRRVSPEADDWEQVGRHPMHVRARGQFAERLLAQVRAGDELIATGQVIEPQPGGDPFDDDGPLPRLLAVVVAQPLT